MPTSCREDLPSFILSDLEEPSGTWQRYHVRWPHACIVDAAQNGKMEGGQLVGRHPTRCSGQTFCHVAECCPGGKTWVQSSFGSRSGWLCDFPVPTSDGLSALLSSIETAFPLVATMGALFSLLSATKALFVLAFATGFTDSIPPKAAFVLWDYFQTNSPQESLYLHNIPGHGSHACDRRHL